MASTFTGATSSTGPSIGSTRKRMLPPGVDPPPSPKKPKKQTKLDKLKAELEGQVGKLRDKLENVKKFLLNEKFAKETAEHGYKSDATPFS